MIRAKRVFAIDEGSCNFCNRQVSDRGTKPDAIVTLIQGNSSSMRCCDPCRDDLLRAIADSRRYGARAVSRDRRSE